MWEVMQLPHEVLAAERPWVETYDESPSGSESARGEAETRRPVERGTGRSLLRSWTVQARSMIGVTAARAKELLTRMLAFATVRPVVASPPRVI